MSTQSRIASKFSEYEAAGLSPKQAFPITISGASKKGKTRYASYLTGLETERVAAEKAAADKATQDAAARVAADKAAQPISGLAPGAYESTIKQTAAATRDIGDTSVPAGAEKAVGALTGGYKGVGEMAVSEYGKQAGVQ